MKNIKAFHIGGNAVEEYVIDSAFCDEAITPADMRKQMGK